MRVAFLVSLCGALALASSAVASHSASPCAAVVTEIDAGVQQLYYVDGQEEGVWSGEFDWLYAESNGHPGLQRGGNAWYGFGLPDGGVDWCWDVDQTTGEWILDPDTILY